MIRRVLVDTIPDLWKRIDSMISGRMEELDHPKPCSPHDALENAGIENV